MKRALAICMLFATAVALWLGHPKPGIVTRASAAPALGPDSRAVTLVFGQKDSQPTKWDGSVEISAGTIEKVAGYRFTRRDSVNGASWQCATYSWPGHPHEMWPSQRPQPHPYLVNPIGVTIYYRGAG